MRTRCAGLQALRLAAALALPLAALPAADAFETADANNPQAYALRLPLVLAPDAALQRLALPAQVLVNLQAPGYHDIRVFNAQGQAVPMALASAADVPPAGRQQLQLSAYPVLGPATAAGLEGLSLRIEEQQGRRVVQINTGNADTTGHAGAPATTAPQLLGVLLDARAVSAPLVALALDADLPEAQPVTFTLQASKDLKSWRLLGQSVLYRAGAAASLGDRELALDFVDVKDHYLRITWAGAAGQGVDAMVRGATLTTSAQGSATPRRVEAALVPPALTDDHALSFSLPFATPLAGLRITPQGGNVLIPLRVLGRNERSQPWTPLASTVLYRLQTAGRVQTSAPVALPGGAFREVRLEADTRVPGFSAPPAITLQFAPVQIVFLASGPAPFVLAAGRAGAPGAYLPIASLMPGYRPAQENALPLAQADLASLQGANSPKGQAGPLVVAAPGAGTALPARSLVLWAILLLGVLALAAMAWALLRQTPKPPA